MFVAMPLPYAWIVARVRCSNLKRDLTERGGGLRFDCPHPRGAGSGFAEGYPQEVPRRPFGFAG